MDEPKKGGAMTASDGRPEQSDTIGFSDTTSIAGVFWHPGGHILNREGNPVHYEPEGSGWYYWFELDSGYRELSSAFKTKAEAEAEFSLVNPYSVGDDEG